MRQFVCAVNWLVRLAGLPTGFLAVLLCLSSVSAHAAGYVAGITTAYPQLAISASAPQVVWSSCNTGGAWPTAYSACDDGVSQVMPIGFSFSFAGTTYSNWSMSTNGAIFFETGSTGNSTGNNTFTPSALPSTAFGSPARPALLPFWADLVKNASVAGANNVGQPAGASFYQYQVLTQPSGAKVLVVQLKDVVYYGATTFRMNLQVQLWSTGEIVYSYGSMQINSGNPLLRVGLQSAGGTVCHTLASNQTTALSNQSFLYTWDSAATACPPAQAVNHYEIRHDGAATLCAEPVTVLACSSATTPCPAASIISNIITAQLVVSGVTTVTLSPPSFNIQPAAPQQKVNLTWSSGSSGTATLGISAAVAASGALTCTNAAGTAASACTMTVANTACILPPHHYEVQGPASGTTCAGQTFTIKAWADAAQTTAYTAAVATGSLSATGNPASIPSLGAFTIPAGSSTVNITPISFPSAGVTTFTTSATPALAGATTCNFGGSTSCAYSVVTCAPHHLEIQGPGSGVTCMPNSYTIKAWADAAQTVAYSSATVTGNLTATGSPTVVYPSGSAFSIASGSSSTTLSVGVTTPGTVVLGTTVSTSAPAGSTTCNFGSPACTYTANSAGFVFTSTASGSAVTVPTQTSGTVSGQYYLRAVQTGSTGACVAVLTNPSSVTMAYGCNNPASCSTGNYLDVTPYNGAAAQATQTVGAGGGALNLYFDVNGSAPLTFNYRDAGQVTLTAAKAAGGSLLTALSGSSNAFVVKPAGFTVSGVKRTVLPLLVNPGATDATGSAFVKAGETFTATVTAVSSSGAATPNFGQESPAESVTLVPTVTAPSPGSDGAVANATVTGFVNGVASPSNLSWSEVGVLSLTPRLADANYLGTGDVVGTTAGNIGRFIPDHFAITPGTATHACSNAFTYFAQDGLDTALTLTAQNLSNGTTANYSGAFAKLGLGVWSNYGFTASPLASGSALSAGATAISGSWGTPALGQASVVAHHLISRPSAPTAETLITLSAKPVDSDGVTSPTVVLVANAPYRYGRLRLLNFYGSELLQPKVGYRAEFYTGVGWGVNALDNCSSPVAANVVLPAGLSISSVGSLSNGVGTITLNTAAVGSYDMAFNLGATAADASCNAAHPASTAANKPWLRFDWCAGGVKDPSARIKLGSPKAPYIFMRERY
jgi:hypothetical protein